MAEKTTWIKLDRNILSWGWYKNANTMRLFLHLLLKANIKDAKFMGTTIRRGQLATSYPSLSREVGLSVRSIRTALEHLKSTGEVTVQPHHDFSLITIQNYDRYQDRPTGQVTGKRQAIDRPSTGNRQQSKNIRIKEGKNIEPAAAESREWEKDIPTQFRGRFRDQAAFLRFWTGGDDP